jgi:hypothetical protein
MLAPLPANVITTITLGFVSAFENAEQAKLEPLL